MAIAPIIRKKLNDLIASNPLAAQFGLPASQPGTQPVKPLSFASRSTPALNFTSRSEPAPLMDYLPTAEGRGVLGNLGVLNPLDASRAAREQTHGFQQQATQLRDVTIPDLERQLEERLAVEQSRNTAFALRPEAAEERALVMPDRSAPEGTRTAASIQQELDAAKTAYQQAIRNIVVAPTPELGVFRSAVDGALRALTSMPAQVAEGLGIAADAAQYFLTGDTTENAVTQGARLLQDVAQEAFPGDAANQMNFFVTLGTGAGSMAGFMLGGIIGKAALGGGRLAGAAVSGGLGAAQSGTSEYETAREADATSLQQYASFFAGLGLGATEAIPLDRMLGRMEVATGGAVSRAFRQGLQGSGEEAVQELFQSIGSDIAAGIYDDEAAIQWGEAFANAAVGAVLGGGIGAFSGFLSQAEQEGTITPEQRTALEAAIAAGAGNTTTTVNGQPVQPPAPTAPGTTGTTGTTPPPAAPKVLRPQDAASQAANRAVLIAAGYDPDDIDAMDPAEVQTIVAELADQGITPPPAAAPAAAQAPPVQAPPPSVLVPPQAAPAPTPSAPSAAAPPQGVPFVITQATRTDLSARGFTAEQIRNLTPAEAQEIVRTTPAAPTNNPASESPAPVATNPAAGAEAGGVDDGLSHLAAIDRRLSHERERLARAATPAEREARSVFVRQIERERSDEVAFLTKKGIPIPAAGDSAAGMTDDELLTELGADTPSGPKLDFTSRSEPAGDGSRAAPVRAAVSGDIDFAGQGVNTEPTAAQAAVGNYRKGHLKFAGLDISIETPRGATRRGTGADGTPWENTSPAAYGYIKRSEGADGDQVDVYLGPDTTSKQVFVVDQIDPATGKFDEAKVIMGTPDIGAARALYEAGFSDGSGASRLGAITEMPVEEFRRLLADGGLKAPVGTIAPTQQQQPAASTGNLNAGRRGGKRGADAGAVSLIEFIGQNGGIRPDPELTAIGADTIMAPGMGRIVGPTALKDLDEMREIVAEAGYFGGRIDDDTANTSVNDLLDLLDRAKRGERIVPAGADSAELEYVRSERRKAAQWKDRITSGIKAWMQENNLDDKQWAKAALRIAEEDGIEPNDMTDEVIDRLMERASFVLADTTMPAAYEEAIADDIPFDFEPADSEPGTVAAGSEQTEQPETFEGGRDGGGRGDGEALPPVGEDQGPQERDVERTDAGDQFTLGDATAPVSSAAIAGKRADEPLRPRAPQQALDVGLFGDDSKQTDLMDLVRAPAKAEPAKAEPLANPLAERRWWNSLSEADRARIIASAGYAGEISPKVEWTKIERDRQGQLLVARDTVEVGSAVADAPSVDAARPDAEPEAGRLPDRGAASEAASEGRTGGTEVADTAPSDGVRGDVSAPAVAAEGGSAEEGSPAIVPPTEAYDATGRLRNVLLDPATKFNNILAARRAAREAGFEGDDKALDEAIEVAVVVAARWIVEQGRPQVETYRALVDLYNRQPRLGVRTSKSVSDQAYSTPVPLAYVAGKLAGMGVPGVVAFEPTAGNGALLITDAGRAASANEIDPDRRKALRSQGYITATLQDATEAATVDYAMMNSYAPKKRKLEGGGGKIPFDVIIANPPFGAVREGGESKVFDIDGFKTTNIDHAIVLNSLKAMKADGKAVFLVAGVKGDTAEQRAEGYRAQAKRKFYTKLYGAFDVTDHFTVAGSLCAKQGAEWPIDVIVINGRGTSSRSLPAANIPTVFASWESLEEKLNVAERGSSAGTRGPADQPVVDVAAGERRPAGGSADATRPPGRSGPVAARPADAAPAVSVPVAGDSGQPVDAGRPAVSPPAAPAGVVRDAGRPDRGAPAVEGRAGLETRTQVPYQPQSRRGDALGTLIPTSLDVATRQALQRAEQQLGNVDQFVADELGWSQAQLREYLKAEQIDAVALGISNVKKGSALVLGDQTGIGKGRVVATMLRWSKRQGMVPVFLTEKVDLYGDMYRDLRDIGVPEVRVLMTNVGATVPLDQEAIEWKTEWDEAKANGDTLPKRRGRFFSGGSAKANEELRRAVAAGEDVVDVVFTTYDQMNSVKGKTTERRTFLEAIAPKAMIVMDEAHNAGGQGDVRQKADAAPTRSKWLRAILKDAKGVMYSSATYAKRPDVMDLYSRTDMTKAVDKAEQLPDLITKGGVPLQQVVADMLARAGQYLRRERSFDGVTYEVKAVEIDRALYSSFTNALGSIYRFDRAFSEDRKEIMKAYLDEIGAAVMLDGSIGDAGANATEFASIMHNLIGQMLLSIKAAATATEAIAAIKEGRRPVIGLSNTMESFLSDYAETGDLKEGDPAEITFVDLLFRYLERTRRITIKPAEGDPYHVTLPVDRLPPDFQKWYRRVEDELRDTAIGDLPVSPIDHIRAKMKAAGLSVAEITGRELMLDYSTTPPTLAKRPKSELGVSGKRSTIRAFNDGKIDVVIINRSGSTGVSMHSSKKEGKDTRKRRMILAQADANIDVHMQMLGRVHRTGQETLPEYVQIVGDIPAEARPTSVLMKKMASLNANTTAARNSLFTAESVDFMNAYGDRVAALIMDDEQDLNAAMGYPVKFEDNGKPKIAGAVKNVLGRITLLQPDQQQDLLDRISTAYQRLIEQLDAIGENMLEAKVLDLQAETTGTVTVRESTGPSVFEGEARFEKITAKSPGRAMPPADVVAVAFDKAGIQTKPSGNFGRDLDLAERAGRVKNEREVAAISAAYATWLKGEAVKFTNQTARAAHDRKADANFARWRATMGMIAPGARVTLVSEGASIPAVSLGVERAGKAKNPAALSGWEVTFAVPEAARTLTIPLSQVYPPNVTKSEDDAGFALSPPDWTVSSDQLADLFEQARKEGREERVVMTGNILAAYDAAKGRGQIVTFTAKDGETRPGILMPRKFDIEGFMSTRPVALRTGAQVVDFLNQAQGSTIGPIRREPVVVSKDGLVAVRKSRDLYGYAIDIDPARQTGGKYYTEKSVRDPVRDTFTRKAGKMTADRLVGPQTAQAVDAMIALGATFETTAEQELAASIVDPTGASKPKPKGLARTAVASRAKTPPAQPMPALKVDPERYERIANDFRSIAGRMFGANAPNIVVQHEIRQSDFNVPNQDKLAESARLAGDTLTGLAAGMYEHHADLSAESVVFLSAAVPGGAPMDRSGLFRVFYHEHWHHAEMSLLTASERALLAHDIAQPNSRLVRYAMKALDASEAAVRALPDYEITAHGFEGYMAERDPAAATSASALTGLHIGIRRAFERIGAFLRAVKNALLRRGITNVNDLFDLTARGGLANRTASSTETSGLAEAGSVLGEDGELARTSFARLRTSKILARVGGWTDTVRPGIQDTMLLWRRVKEQIERETGTKIAGNMDVWAAETQFSGRAGERLVDLREKIIEPMIEHMNKVKVTAEEVGDYLYYQHHAERRAEMLRINPQVTDNDQETFGSGISNDDARAIRRRLAGKWADLAAVAKHAYAMRDNSLNLMVSSGLISRQTADDWLAKYPNYVPMRGFEADPDGEVRPRLGFGFDVRGPESMRATGRRSKADNPLAYLMMQAEQTIVRSEKNRVLRAVMALIKAYPDSNVWQVVKAVMVTEVDPRTGMTRTRAVPPQHSHKADQLFALKIGGKTVWLEIKQEALARALRGIGRDDSGIVQAAVTVARFYAMLQTQLSPEFVFTNFVRDVQTALINVMDTENVPAGTKRKILKDAITWANVRGIYKELRNPTGNTEIAQWWDDFRMNGGKVSFIQTNDIQSIKKRMERDLNRGMIMSAAKGFFQFVDDANTAVENSARLSVYMHLVKNGFPKAKAAVIAKELTVNFNRKGSWSPIINALWIFFNASVQGNFRMARAMVKSRAVQKFMVGIFALGFAQDMLNSLMGDDDEDGRNSYDDGIEDHVKERNMIVTLPFGLGVVLFPLTYGYSAIYNAGRLMSATIRGAVTPASAIGQALGGTLESFNPMGSSPTLLQFLAPTLLDPVAQLSENRTWYGGVIYPEKFGDDNKLNSELVWDETPGWYSSLARTLNRVTGGTIGRPGSVDVSPEAIEHMAEFIQGGAGRFWLNLIKTGARLIGGEEVLTEDVPILRRFYSAESSVSLRREFYDLWDQVSRARYELREFSDAGDRAGYTRVREEYGAELRAYPAFNEVRQTLNEMSDARLLIERDQTITGEERAQRLDALAQRERDLIRRAMQIYSAASGE